MYGITGAKKVTISKDVSEKSGEKKYIYNLFVEGNVLQQILSINEVDEKETFSIDINEIL